MVISFIPNLSGDCNVSDRPTEEELHRVVAEVHRQQPGTIVLAVPQPADPRVDARKRHLEPYGLDVRCRRFMRGPGRRLYPIEH
jgi:hypothetical protein